MTEILLGSIILALIVVNVYLYGKMLEVNERYMRAFMAHNLTDYTQSEIMKKEEPAQKVQEEFVPLGEADEGVFSKYLKQNEDGGQNERPEV